MTKNGLVALFVEGDTEIEFYKALISHMRQKMGTQFGCSIQYINIKGISRYKSRALKVLKQLQSESPDKAIKIFICIDVDVFKFAQKPPLNKRLLKKTLKNEGAQKVVFIEAEQSIEDWFLKDYQGVLKCLRLPQTTKPPQGKGQDVLTQLFKKAKRLYLKGAKAANLIQNLNMETIMEGICPEIKPLCKELGLDCAKVCSKPS